MKRTIRTKIQQRMNDLEHYEQKKEWKTTTLFDIETNVGNVFNAIRAI